MQPFPNFVDNGTVFSKSSNILLDPIGLVCFLKHVEGWLRGFGKRQRQRQSIKKYSDVSSIKQPARKSAPRAQMRGTGPGILRRRSEAESQKWG